MCDRLHAPVMYLAINRQFPSCPCSYIDILNDNARSSSCDVRETVFMNFKAFPKSPIDFFHIYEICVSKLCKMCDQRPIKASGGDKQFAEIYLTVILD